MLVVEKTSTMNFTILFNIFIIYQHLDTNFELYEFLRMSSRNRVMCAF